jgi:hypothetical protein
MIVMFEDAGSRVTCLGSETPGRGFWGARVHAKTGHNDELNQANRWQDHAHP